MKNKYTVLIMLGVGLLASGIVFLFRINGSDYTLENIFRYSCDGFFCVGIVYLCFAGLGFVSGEGGFDAMDYTRKTIMSKFRGEPIEKYGTYLDNKVRKKKNIFPNLFCGAIFFIVAIILSFLV